MARLVPIFAEAEFNELKSSVRQLEAGKSDFEEAYSHVYTEYEWPVTVTEIMALAMTVDINRDTGSLAALLHCLNEHYRMLVAIQDNGDSAYSDIERLCFAARFGDDEAERGRCEKRLQELLAKREKEIGDHGDRAVLYAARDATMITINATAAVIQKFWDRNNGEIDE